MRCYLPTMTETFALKSKWADMSVRSILAFKNVSCSICAGRSVACEAGEIRGAVIRMSGRMDLSVGQFTYPSSVRLHYGKGGPSISFCAVKS
ncbi:hypothetical protein CDAR_27701 [Caerostris darwini]|uniref:Uncharacterized protein n=1 Tax=Caerostris darwini TaxID=1538125 RepID=A0AAV4STD1_9ARAC|nr:hypothetical protein CDAR_27701 [Caerostris darwini]